MAPPSLLDRIEHWTQATPEAVAHEVGARRTTYRELGRMIDAVAARLQRDVPDDGSPVAIFGHKEPEMLAGFLGALKAGHPYVPIDRAAPEERVRVIVGAAQASCLLTVDEIAALPSPPQVARASRVIAGQGPFDRPLYLLFTSGSTGVPKGVAITERNLAAFLDWTIPLFGMPSHGGVVLNQASFGFDLSVADMYWALTRGGTLVSLTGEESASPGRLVEALRRSEAQYWLSTPSFGALCLADRGFGEAVLPRLENVVFAGERLPPPVARAFVERFPRARIWNAYGPTETTIIMTAMRVDASVLDRYPALPIGYVMPGVRLEACDETGEVRPAGEEGELVIGGVAVSPGYFRRPDLTSNAFSMRDGLWSYRSGDLGHREDKLWFCHGRRDLQVKLHGYRIELGDVEANLRRLPGIHDAAVVPRLRNGTISALRAMVVVDDANPRDFDATICLKDALAQLVPLHMVPQHVHFIDAIPLNANGKIDRARLAALPMDLVLTA